MGQPPVRHYSSQALIGVIDSQKVSILLGEDWKKKKIQPENVNFGEEKKKSVDLKRKGKRVTSVFIYLEAVKVSDPNIFQGFPGFQRNDMKWCI